MAYELQWKLPIKILEIIVNKYAGSVPYKHTDALRIKYIDNIFLYKKIEVPF